MNSLNNTNILVAGRDINLIHPYTKSTYLIRKGDILRISVYLPENTITIHTASEEGTDKLYYSKDQRTIDFLERETDDPS